MPTKRIPTANAARVPGGPTPLRVQLRRAKGWRIPPDTVKVDRTTPWGNPFVVGQHGTRERCVGLHRFLLDGLVCVTTADHMDAQREYLRHAGQHIGELRGKNLACWCRLDQACHADTLLALANRPAAAE